MVHYIDRYRNGEITAFFREAVGRLAAGAAQRGFTLAVETASYKPDEYPHCPDTSELAAFVKSFDSPHVRICMDLNHANNHEDLVQAIRNCTGLIATIHVSDNHGTREEHLAPGEGVIDFEAAFRALREGGYRGAVNMEVREEGTSGPGRLDALAAWARAAERRHPAPA